MFDSRLSGSVPVKGGLGKMPRSDSILANGIFKIDADQAGVTVRWVWRPWFVTGQFHLARCI